MVEYIWTQCSHSNSLEINYLDKLKFGDSYNCTFLAPECHCSSSLKLIIASLSLSQVAS